MRRALALGWLAGLLAACGGADGPPSPAHQIRAMERAQADAEALWAQRGPASYRLVTEFVTLGSDVTMTVEVRQGAVASHECQLNHRQASIACDIASRRPERFTVDGLFASARELRVYAEGYKAIEPREAMSVVYDKDLGYPAIIRWTPPEWTGWTVVSFEPLP
ncbi:MAG TPA: DUF6174 domain-containing protein [Herpetosiphonaceae bacterium]